MYTIIDIEGNGAGYRQESIIDIAIFRFDGHQIMDQFFSLVNPQAEITPYVQKLTGISMKMVRTAPKFHELARRILEITEGTTLVGHNIDFDYRMLRQEFKRLGYTFQIPTLDTIPLAQSLIPNAESYSLEKLVKSLGIPLANAHRAESDARATLELFKVLMSKDIESNILQQLHEQNNAKNHPSKVKTLTQDLPNEAGILYFQSSNGKILHTTYVDNMNGWAKKLLNTPPKRLDFLKKETAQIYYEKVGNALLAQIILIQKGLFVPREAAFGLYRMDGNWSIKHKSVIKNQSVPILQFSRISQAMKVLRYIRESDWSNSLEEIEQALTLISGKKVYTMNGREQGEKAFIVFDAHGLVGYGFYQLHTQISSWKKLQQMMIPLILPKETLLNEFKLALLKNEVFSHQVT